MNKVHSYKKLFKRILLSITVIVLLSVLIPVTIGIYYFNKADFKCPNDSIYPEEYVVQVANDTVKYNEQD